MLHKLNEQDLLHEYDRFIITRSDYLYQLPHPSLELLDNNYIWVPDSEHYGGYTDRHVILNKTNLVPYLNILNNMILNSKDYYTKLQKECEWNLEKIIKFNLEQQLQEVKEFPYVMYTVRNKDTGSRWSFGSYSGELGYYIKYQSELDRSSHYKREFEASGLSPDEFYYRILHPVPLKAPIPLPTKSSRIKMKFTLF